MVKLTRSPSSLGNSPAKSKNVSNRTTHVCWDIHLAEWLTVEAACDHLELLEIGKGAPLRRDSTGELVLVDVGVAKAEHLERNWELLGQFTCKTRENVGIAKVVAKVK